jgi:hypothetical protein
MFSAFFEIHAVYEMWNNILESKGSHDNMVHVHYMLDTKATIIHFEYIVLIAFPL